MAINTDAERAEFEAWARDQYPSIDLARDGDGYSRFLENDYWSLWQAARRTQAAPAPAQEPFGYFKAEPFGWRDCAETDEGAIALYEAPQPQADARAAERVDALYTALEVCSAELFAQCAHQGRAMKYVEQARKALAAEQCARAAIAASKEKTE